jgi:hypothetical protein
VIINIRTTKWHLLVAKNADYGLALERQLQYFLSIK